MPLFPQLCLPLIRIFVSTTPQQYSDDEDAEDGGSRQAKADNSSQREMAERHVTEMTYGPGRHYQGGEGKEEGEEEEEEGESTSTLSRQSQHYFNDMFQVNVPYGVVSY